MNHRLALALLASSLFFPACAMNTGDPTASSSGAALSMSADDAARVLALVNYPGTDRTTLDDAVGLDARAAQNIAAYRAGDDGVVPSADDRYFGDLGELDAVPYVGDSAFQKLQAYAANHAVPAAESVEGVYFRGWQSQTVVWAVDHLDEASLDAVLDSRAAKNLVAARPFSTVTAMGPVSYVGGSALASLRDAATTWWPLMQSNATESLAGTFDGVAFDEPTAETALEIANQASAARLTAHGVATHPADLMVAGRAYTTLAAVAGVSGVGTATMAALHDYATSGDWGQDPNACVDAFQAAVSPHLGDLLLMSESDRPLDLVSYPGAGTQAPTADSVLALVGAEAGSTAEVRTLDYFKMVLEPSSDNADPNAAADVVAAIGAQLTDVIVVKVHKPQNDPYSAEVDMYVLGRTSCGDLVGLHAIAIET